MGNSSQEVISAVSDWFINSAHASASNAWAAAGLAKLAIMATVADSPNASRYAAEAKGIRDAMHALLWDATATPPRYCDGVCDDAKVQHHGGVVSNTQPAKSFCK